MSFLDDDDAQQEEPNRRFTIWDLAGITIFTFGTCLNEIDNGCRVLANMCVAAANYSREQTELREQEWREDVARAEMAGALEGIVLFDGLEDEPS